VPQPSEAAPATKIQEYSISNGCFGRTFACIVLPPCSGVEKLHSNYSQGNLHWASVSVAIRPSFLKKRVREGGVKWPSPYFIKRKRPRLLRPRKNTPNPGPYPQGPCLAASTARGIFLPLHCLPENPSPTGIEPRPTGKGRY
jgi:hypothetical protein